MDLDSSKDVFKKLQINLTVSVLVILALALAALIGSMNIYLFQSNKKEAKIFMSMLVANEGMLNPEKEKPILSALKAQVRVESDDYLENGIEQELLPQEFMDRFEFQSGNHNSLGGRLSQTFRQIVYPLTPGSSGFRDYYTAKVSFDGQVLQVIRDFSNDLSQKKADSLVYDIFESGKTTGRYKNMGYMISPRKYGYLIVLLDREVELSQQLRFMLVSILTYGISLIAALAFAWGISLWCVKPVKDTFLKQKQFIADASHELKTPIAVIGANIDVLGQEIPHNKWLEYIRAENSRMGLLVKDMLYLAKNDANRIEHQRVSFDLCHAVSFSVLPFESVAWEQKKKLEIDIPKEVIPVLGDEQEIKRVAIILTDNALKNSDEGDTIRVSVGSEGVKCFVKVYNTGHGIAPEDMEKIFNRFYRSDASRARSTGGYGLGLAIAKVIAESHGGRITVGSVPGEYAEFTLHLPREIIHQKKHSKNTSDNANS